MNRTYETPKPTVVDLFCGAGGLSVGFEQSGYRIAAGVDYSTAATETFARNLAGALPLPQDIGKLKAVDIAAAVGQRIDLIVAGPSCQGFSTSGGLSKASGRDVDDPRNRLFTDYLRLVDELRPAWVVFENVPGLLLYHQGRVAIEIAKAFRAIGYLVAPMILLAADYGVPQLRRRLVFVGNRTGAPIAFPLPTHGNPELWADYALPFTHLSRLGHGESDARLPHVSFADACSDLPVLREGAALDGVPYRTKPIGDYQRRMRRRSRVVRQHVAFELSATDRFAARTLRPGQNWRDLPADSLPERFRRIRPYDATTLLKRLEADKPAYTITTKFNEATTGAFIHPTQARTLSVREAARLQSFPDRFVFSGTPTHIRQQIGNAVPPLLAQAVAEAIYPYVMKDVFGLSVAPTREALLVDADQGDLLRLHAARKRRPFVAAQQPSLELAI